MKTQSGFIVVLIAIIVFITEYQSEGSAFGLNAESPRIQSDSVTVNLLLAEHFDYEPGTELTANGWGVHSLGGTNPVTVYDGGLTYAGYPEISGNAALLDNDGEDVNKPITQQTSGTLYYSFLVRVSSAPTGYFIHLAKDASVFAARVYVRNSLGNLQFGLSNTSTGTYSSTNFTFNTTYLCIVKYNVSVGGACTLWVKSSGVPESEEAAGTPEVIFYTNGTGVNDIRRIALRQYHATQGIIVDEIRISDSWAQAPMPVRLNYFNSLVNGRDIRLKWATDIEENNAGFEIQRSAVSGKGTEWQSVGFVKGNGNSNITVSYNFEDRNLNSGKYLYRLKQVDVNGYYEYFELNGEVEIGVPKKYYMSQNYPNPFNPVTVINLDLPESGLVSIRLYDMLGREAAVILNKNLKAGYHTVRFNASALPSGVYFYRMVAGKHSSVRRMVLLK